MIAAIAELFFLSDRSDHMETRLNMPRPRRQREHQKSHRLNRQNNNSARAARFFVHFFAVTARLRRENA